MKFKFSFEKILSHKKVLEDIARRDFAEAQNKLDMEVIKKNQLIDLLKESYRQKFEIQKQGGSVASDLRAINEFAHGTKVSIERQDLIIEGLSKILEEKRKRLIEAAQQHKTYEKLREKKKADFKQALKKKEIKNLDELVVTYAKRGKENE